jgi:rhamnose transport system ATP-binding protein
VSVEDLVLDVRGLRKRYGGVHALRDADFQVRLGEVHALIGENGAGKSTLIKMLAGVETPDDGTIHFRGEVLPLGDPHASLKAGISTVYQESHLFGELSVAENMFLGREIRSGGRVQWSEEFDRAAELLTEIGLDPGYALRRVGELSVGEQQLISIAKAFGAKVRLLILDEPSAILADRDIETLFSVVRRLRDTGVGVVYISHRLDELAQIADRVTVMRDGRVVTTDDIVNLSTRQLAELMVGHELGTVDTTGRVVSQDVALALDSVSAGRALKDVSLQLHSGEVLGVYGLIGSGTSELVRALYGITPARTGKITVRGRPMSFTSPSRAAAAGVAMLPGNRKAQGVFLDKPLTFNMSVSHLRYFSRFGFFMDRRREKGSTVEFMQRLSVKAPSPRTLIGALSGGNQQKVVMARQLVESPELLVLEEPTQGVDIGAKGEIHSLILELARDGAAVLVISTDLDEMRTLSDRVIVLRNGEIAGTFGRGARTASLLASASGDTTEHETSPDEEGTR